MVSFLIFNESVANVFFSAYVSTDTQLINSADMAVRQYLEFSFISTDFDGLRLFVLILSRQAGKQRFLQNFRFLQMRTDAESASFKTVILYISNRL